MTAVLGRALEAAQAKYEKCKAMAAWRGGIAKRSQYINVDLSKYPADGPFGLLSVGTSDNAIHAIISTLKRYKDQVVTPKMLRMQMVFCGFGPMLVGTPEIVADVMEDWVNNADINGFNVACKPIQLLPRRCSNPNL
jgi:alkanesulfonate monooxygenase SsuD/methylene tetrahydromethanopterin reductase-like flavin-dependent oxidoreductase (luciferase family)